MSFLGVSVPHPAARLFHDIDVPGQKEDTAQLHITLVYLDDNVPIKQLAKAMVAVYEVTSKTSPFLVKTSSVDCFPATADSENPEANFVPIICPITSVKLHELQSACKKSFDKHSVKYSKKFKDYKPHVTLSYHNDYITKTKIDCIEWAVQEIVLWGGDDGDGRVFTTFPLSLKKKVSIAEACDIFESSIKKLT